MSHHRMSTRRILSQADWEAEFAKYRQSPEYQRVNRGMGLDDFKFIYWCAYSHSESDGACSLLSSHTGSWGDCNVGMQASLK